MIIQEHSPPPKDPSHSKTPTPRFSPHPLLSNFPVFFVVSGRCLCRISPDGRRQEGLSDWQHLRSVPLFRGARGLLSKKWGMCQNLGDFKSMFFVSTKWIANLRWLKHFGFYFGCAQIWKPPDQIACRIYIYIYMLVCVLLSLFSPAIRWYHIHLGKS